MSMNIPKSFTREEFQKLTNKTLGNKPQDNNPFQQYKKISPGVEAPGLC